MPDRKRNPFGLSLWGENGAPLLKIYARGIGDPFRLFERMGTGRPNEEDRGIDSPLSAEPKAPPKLNTSMLERLMKRLTPEERPVIPSRAIRDLLDQMEFDRLRTSGGKKTREGEFILNGPEFHF